MTGQAKLLGQPEYHDIEKAQAVLTNLDEDVISNLPATLSSGARTQILVGPENVAKELKDTSVVMTKFDIGDGMQGMIGVWPHENGLRADHRAAELFCRESGQNVSEEPDARARRPQKNNTPEG